MESERPANKTTGQTWQPIQGLKNFRKKRRRLQKQRKLTNSNFKFLSLWDSPWGIAVFIASFMILIILIARLFSTNVHSFFSPNITDNSYSRYFLTIFNVNTRIKDELDFLNTDLESTAVQFYVYTPDLQYRVKAGGAGEITISDNEFVLVSTDQVYAQQLEDHIYNRCSYFDVLKLPDSEYKAIVLTSRRRHVFSCPINTQKGLEGYIAVSYNTISLPTNIEEIKNIIRFSIANIIEKMNLDTININQLTDEELFIPPTSKEFRQQIIKSSQDFFDKQTTFDPEGIVVTAYFFNPGQTTLSPLMRLVGNKTIPGFVPGRDKIQLTGRDLRPLADRLIKKKQCYVIPHIRDLDPNSRLAYYMKSFTIGYLHICPIVQGDGQVIGAAEIGIKETYDISHHTLHIKLNEFTNWIRDDVYLYLYLN